MTCHLKEVIENIQDSCRKSAGVELKQGCFLGTLGWLAGSKEKITVTTAVRETYSRKEIRVSWEWLAEIIVFSVGA
jgi:hypothetical protein